MLCSGIQNKTTINDVTKLRHKCRKTIFISFKWQISVNIFKYVVYIQIMNKVHSNQHIL